MLKKDLLVRFHDTTYVLSSDVCKNETAILQYLSSRTGWPLQGLSVTGSGGFYTVRVVSILRGGKGGFGTLLKGSARQAGAKQTTDFGACRDLQGRRLKHVNDQVAFREWKQWSDKVDAGLTTQEEMAQALIKSSAAASGLPGWYLQLPSWAEVSQKKQQAQLWKQFHTWKRQLQVEKTEKERVKQAIERQIHEYIDRADVLSKQASQNTASALLEGLRANKRQRTEDESPPEAIMTLSGDAVLAREDGRWCLQSPSNFCTIGIILEARQNSDDALYFEVCLQTGGLVQLGWATSGFQPDSSAGDGVGDDSYSYSFDPSRKIKLHAGATAAFPIPEQCQYKAGDVVGCMFNYRTGDISYSLNGDQLGVAYQVKSPHGTLYVYPAISCNQGEIVELRMQQEEMEYCPEGATVIGTRLSATPEVVEYLGSNPMQLESIDPAAEASESSKENKSESIDNDSKPAAIVVEPLDLKQFESAKQLEELGLDRLKGALMAIGVKCGGSLQERAARLWSLNGLKASNYPQKLLAKK
jgi:hypothetical protein